MSVVLQRCAAVVWAHAVSVCKQFIQEVFETRRSECRGETGEENNDSMFGRSVISWQEFDVLKAQYPCRLMDYFMDYSADKQEDVFMIVFFDIEGIVWFAWGKYLQSV